MLMDLLYSTSSQHLTLFSSSTKFPRVALQSWSALLLFCVFFFFSSRRRHTRCSRDWSSDVCSSDLLKYFDMELAGKVNNVFMLKGGMGKKQRRSIAEAIAAVPEGEPRVILATGSYIGEGFDDARLDTLFLAMPISWKGTLQQYVGRLHRLHDAKRVVRVYDYVDSNVPMLARMYARRLKGYALIGYTIRDTSYETSFLQQLERQAPKEPSINGEI